MVHQLLAKVDAQTADLAFLKRKRDVGIRLFERIEGNAGIPQQDGQHHPVRIELRTDFDPAKTAVVGITDYILDRLLDGEPDFELEGLIFRNIGRRHQVVDDLAALVDDGFKSLFHSNDGR